MMKPVPENNQKQIKRNAHSWHALLNLTIFSAYFYAFMEWLFFVTKPSSLSTLTLLEMSRVLVVTGGIIALPLVVALIILSLPAWLTRGTKRSSRLLGLSYLVPALVLSVTALVMFDNFTYTVFKFGIVSSAGMWRGLYTIGFGLFLWQALRFTHRTVRKRQKKIVSFLAIGLLAASTGIILATSLMRNNSPGEFNAGTENTSSNRPNIIILGSDGLSARYLSAYGYVHDTTPFLRQIMETSLVAENAFPNASSTTASTASVLTGKEPASVGVYRYPDVLSGQNSFEHLPGILKQYGYTTVEIGTPYYVDAQKLNLLDGFDIVNNQSLNLPALGLLRTVLGNSPSTYFIWTMFGRASERLQHIYFIEEMQNPLEEVNNPSARMSDDERVDQIIELLNQADGPVFVFAHLMDTHGPNFSSSKQKFASDSSDASGDVWDRSLYEESLRDFDKHVENIYTRLSQTGQLNNTLLIIYTDHGYQYAVNQRIPIIMHFPKNEYAGTRSNNVQIIDIPIIVLDYLGISDPVWMTGVSLLDGEPPTDRHIVSITAGSPRKIDPPFYQIKIVQVIVCHKWYALNVQENKWRSGDIYKHTAKCDEELLPFDTEVRQEILNYLENYGYNVSLLK